MDYTLSLAHFCDTHGPVSVLCTQNAPVECPSCYPNSLSSSFHDLKLSQSPPQDSPILLSASGSFDFADVHESNHGDSPAWTDIKIPTSLPDHTSMRAERRKLYEAGCETKYCVACSIFAPESVAKKLPRGCPGSKKADGASRYGSPIMRSAERQQVWDEDTQFSSEDEGPDTLPKESTPESYPSGSSSVFHTHTHNYITTSNPINPNIYTFFRKLVLRTLTGEELPRGLTSGKFAFDDSADRTTVVYRFRLYDEYARGKYRHYALIALAGNRTRSAFKAVAHIWERFELIADWITRKVEDANGKSEAEKKRKEDQGYFDERSFLTATRVRDRMRMRGLKEMTGDETFFAALHLQFIGLLRELRERYPL